MSQRTDSAAVPKSIRIGSFLLAVLLTFLLVWLLGFLLRDIGLIDGPDYKEVRSEFIDDSLEKQVASLQQEIAKLERQAQRQGEIQEDLKRSMNNARDTMQEMRIALEKQSTPTEEERNALATAQQRFLEAQDRYEDANIEITRLKTERYDIEASLDTAKKQLARQEEPAREKYEALTRKHQFRLASFKLAVIVPLLALSAWWFFKKWRSPYRLIPLAALAATFWKLGVVMHEHFPLEFFKYIAIVAGIGAVLVFLVWLLRRAARPDRNLLLNRYREGYRAHVCPVCAYPIQRGILKLAIWNRKGPQLPGHLPTGESVEEETPFACASCGTTLFESCESCGGSRHSLLPYCEHCGKEKAGEGEERKEA
jgi:hypothetical protein